jgi:hypothetical protein
MSVLFIVPPVGRVDFGRFLAIIASMSLKVAEILGCEGSILHPTWADGADYFKHFAWRFGSVEDPLSVRSVNTLLKRENRAAIEAVLDDAGVCELICRRDATTAKVANWPRVSNRRSVDIINSLPHTEAQDIALKTETHRDCDTGTCAREPALREMLRIINDQLYNLVDRYDELMLLEDYIAGMLTEDVVYEENIQENVSVRFLRILTKLYWQKKISEPELLEIHRKFYAALKSAKAFHRTSWKEIEGAGEELEMIVLIGKLPLHFRIAETLGNLFEENPSRRMVL